jgi:transcriptional/translational regulatory protein YebC/TACO1
VKRDGDKFEITCDANLFAKVADALQKAGVPPESSQLTRIPTNTVNVDDPDTARKVLTLVEQLDNHDDVQSVAANFNIPDEAMAQIAG